MPDAPEKDEEQLIGELVEYYKTKQHMINLWLQSLQAQVIVRMSQPPLSTLVHSVKSRLKDAEHLRDKLTRKLQRCRDEQTSFDIRPDNLLEKITDLGGYRILHLHTHQFATIHEALMKLLDDANWDHHEPPSAHVWDEEARKYFEDLDVKTEVNPRLYSSVHYLIRPRGKTEPVVEIQVRTLADELWGEVDHKINYPHTHESLTCREQIKVLARVASSCSRLVDSIMASHEDWMARRSKE